MHKDEILEKLKNLKLDKSKYLVLSGASLVVQGVIEETSDIDLSCSKEFYDSLEWDEKIGFFDVAIKGEDVFEIGYKFYDEYIDNCVIIEGIRFMSLQDCLDLKCLTNRPKDQYVIARLKNIIGTEK